MLSLSADHVAAFTLWPHGPAATTVVCELLFHPDEQARPDLRPLRRGRLLGPGQPPGLGHLRERPAGHVVARLHRRLVRPHGGAEPRHPPLRPRPPGRGRSRSGAVTGRADGPAERRRAPRRRACATGTWWWSGWGRWAARPPGPWPGPGPGCWGWSSSSSATTGGRRTTTPGSSAAPTTRPATCAWPAWPTTPGPSWNGEAEERLVVTTGGLDLFPAGSAIPPGPYRASLEACGVPYQWLDAAEVMRRWPAVPARRRRPRPLAGRRRHRPGGPRHPAAAAPGHRRTAPPCSTRPR